MMNIAIALNRKYVKHTCVMLHSLFKNHLTTDVCVYVLHSELTEEDCKLMQSIQEQYLRGMLRFVYIEKELIPDDFPTTTFWTREMYYRLMLVDLLPASVTRILYLDIDMIVNKDITELYDMDFEGRSLIVSKDMEFENMMEHSCSGNAAHDRMFKQLQEEGHVYFCSGLVLFNIKKIKENLLLCEFSLFIYLFSFFSFIISKMFLQEYQIIFSYISWLTFLLFR